MSSLWFGAELALCMFVVTMTRLYLLPTVALLPFLRSHFPYIREEALYCVQEHGSRSARVAKAVFENLFSGNSRVEEQSLKAFQYLGQAISACPKELAELLERVSRRADKEKFVKVLSPSIERLGPKALPFVQLYLELTERLPPGLAWLLKQSACRLVRRGDLSKLPLPASEKLMISVAEQALSEKFSRSLDWIAALTNVAEYLRREFLAARIDEMAITELENELGLLIMQHPKSRAIDDVASLIHRLRNAFPAEDRDDDAD